MIELKKKIPNGYAILPLHAFKIERLINVEKEINLHGMSIVSKSFLKKCFDINKDVKFFNCDLETRKRIIDIKNGK